MLNDAEDLRMMGAQLEQMGFTTVNLNCGCPSGTVVSKNRGAGILKNPDELDRFLEKAFAICPLLISVKTRIGMESEDEWARLCEIYARYPMEELIVHPRVRSDFYSNMPRLDAFAYAVKKIKVPLCYNGDINTVEDYERIHTLFPSVESVMIGRGLLADPGLVREIKGKPKPTKQQIRAFHDEIVQGYTDIFSGDKDVVGHMKELWFYLIRLFPQKADCLKKIQKCHDMVEYRLIVQQILS